MRAPRINRRRQPKELLGRVCATLLNNWMADLDTPWGAAAEAAYDEACILRYHTPPDLPTHARRYFGPAGGLRNPFPAK